MGADSFLRKWGVTQRDFDKQVLHRGEIANDNVVIESVDLSRFKLKAELMIRLKR